MVAGASDLAAASRDRSAQCELEWDAREFGSAAAARSRMRAAEAAHGRALAREAAAQAAVTEHAVSSAADLAAAAVANETRVELQVAEIDDAKEAQLGFEQALSAVQARYDHEAAKVVAETQARREAGLSRELDKASGALHEALSAIGIEPLIAVIDELADAASAVVADRAELRRLRSQKEILDRRRVEPKDVLETDPKVIAKLKISRLRAEAMLSEAEERVLDAEAARRAASETAVQAALREALRSRMHKLSSLFSTSDADGDGTVTRDEFHRVLPVLAVPGATHADADAIFEGFARGHDAIEYRDILRELSRTAAPKPSPPPPKQATPPASPRPEPAVKAKGKGAPPAKPSGKGPAAAKGARAPSAPKARPTGAPAGRAPSAPKGRPAGRR